MPFEITIYLTASVGNLVRDQLDDAMKEFVLDPKDVSVNENAVYISAIFDWFTEDFVATKKNTDPAIIEYINRFRVVGQSLAVDARLKSLKYDKSIINRQK